MRVCLCLLPRGTPSSPKLVLASLSREDRCFLVFSFCTKFAYIRSCVDRVDTFFSLREGWMSSFDFLLDPILVYLNVSKDKKQAVAKWRHGSSSPLDLEGQREREKVAAWTSSSRRSCVTRGPTVLYTLLRSSNIFLARDVRSNARKHLFIVDIPCATRTV